MKTLYLDCGMGAAGDMITAALLELFPQPQEIIRKLNSLGIPHVEFSTEKVSKCGILGTHVSVKIHGEEEHEHAHDGHSHTHSHHHSHRSLHDIEHILEHMHLSAKIKSDVLNVYNLIAEAESNAHGVPVSEIHFHEVGNLDAIADVTAVCFLMNQLSPEKVIVSPVHVGSGQVHCAHGILPVPAPATAYILRDCPIYGGKIRGELCTPTGAALLKYFSDEFGEMPVMKVSSIGYGMGKKDFEAANCVRAMFGRTEDSNDVMYELHCNVDDMTAEQIGFALECFFAAGAVEAFTLPIQMKKSRPGTLICVICKEALKNTLIETIFRHTSTAGIREIKTKRSILSRSMSNIETPYGTIRRKEYSGYGIHRFKYEYEDLAAIAREQNLSILEILKNIKS